MGCYGGKEVLWWRADCFWGDMGNRRCCGGALTVAGVLWEERDKFIGV